MTTAEAEQLIQNLDHKFSQSVAHLRDPDSAALDFQTFFRCCRDSLPCFTLAEISCVLSLQRYLNPCSHHSWESRRTLDIFVPLADLIILQAEFGADLVSSAVKYLLVSGIVGFPFKRCYLKSEIVDLFARLVDFVPQIDTTPGSCLVKWSSGKMASAFPFTFDGPKTFYTVVTDDTLHALDRITDNFTEKCRLSGKRKDSQYSPLEAWSQPEFVATTVEHTLKRNVNFCFSRNCTHYSILSAIYLPSNFERLFLSTQKSARNSK